MNQENKYKEAEESLRFKITAFTEQQEIQAQLSEAYYIWLDDPYVITDYKSEDEIDDETFTKFFDWFLYDFKLFDSQKRVLEKFYDENINDLDETEKEIAQDWQESVNSFFEIVDIKAGDGCTVKDIFTEETIYVADKNASESLTTSDLISARPLKTGEVFHFSGVISAFTKLLKQNIIDHFNQDFNRYKKDYGNEKTVKEYLKDWGYLLINFIEDLLTHPQYINADGEDFVIAKAYYRFKGKKDLLSSLRKSRELTEVSKKNSALNVFIMKDDSSSFIEVEKNTLTVECNSQKTLEAIKSKLEKALENKINHKEDTIKTPGSFVGGGNKDGEYSQNKEFEDSLDEYYEQWIKTPLERLKGKTPIAAYKDNKIKNELELVLLELEKLYDDAKRHGEPYYDVTNIREKIIANN